MALTLRQQLAKGSKWTVKSDFTAENHLGAQFNWVPDPDRPGRQMIVQTHKHMTEFKAGEQFIVTDKTTTYPPHWNYDNKGVYVPIKLEGRGEGSFLLADLKEHIEIKEAVEQLIFVFYSPSLGYIVKVPWHSYGDGAEKEIKEAEKTGGILYTDKLSKAMKKKRLQDTKMFLLNHSGYYDGIDTSDVYYVFEPGGVKVDYPDDLEIHTIDKATKTVKDTYLAADYLKEAFRLRPLTLKYGSPIRSVFKDMEEKKLDFKTLLMFQDPNPDIYSAEPSKLITSLKDDLKSMKLDRKAYIMKSDYRTVAIGFADRGQALMFKLRQVGGLQSKMVDAETLDEVSK